MKQIELEELRVSVENLKNKVLEINLEQDKKDVEDIGKAIEKIKNQLKELRVK